jgi:hypothetical protein
LIWAAATQIDQVVDAAIELGGAVSPAASPYANACPQMAIGRVVVHSHRGLSDSRTSLHHPDFL